MAKHKVPTARQIAFAVSLGIRFNTSWSREILSEQISFVTEKQQRKPATSEQLRLAEIWEVELYDNIKRGNAASRLFEFWEENQRIDLPDFMVISGSAKAKNKTGCLLLILAFLLAVGFWLAS